MIPKNILQSQMIKLQEENALLLKCREEDSEIIRRLREELRFNRGDEYEARRELNG